MLLAGGREDGPAWYVSDGLVHMWDALERQTLPWDDLAGNTRLDVRNSDYSWGKDCIRLNGASVPYTYLYTTGFDGTGFDGHTVQVVARWRATASGQWGRFFCLRQGVNSPCEILIDKTAVAGIGRLRFESYNGTTILDADVENADMTQPFTASVILDPSSRSMYGYFNARKSSVAQGAGAWQRYPSNMVVGSNELGYNNCGVDADFFSVRIYNRPLSENEIMQNNQVDAQRFEILGGGCKHLIPWRLLIIQIRPPYWKTTRYKKEAA